MKLARAVVLLAAEGVRRLLREGLVVRSLVWPGLLVALTLAAVLGVLALLRSEPDVAVDDGTPPELVAALHEAGLATHVVADAEAAVRSGRELVATDGSTVWERASDHALTAEIALRAARGSTWTPVRPPRTPLGAERTSDLPRLPDDAVVRVLALLFALYGLVFGLGGVARDRDAGILDAELSLPIPRWATGFARWLGSSAVLCGFLALSVAMVTAVLPGGDPLPALLHGVAATLTAIAVGMAVVGQAGLRAGFSGPFGVGMTLVTGIASAGWRWDLPWLPVASLFSTRPGWAAVAVSCAAGVVGSFVYARRSGGPP